MALWGLFVLLLLTSAAALDSPSDDLDIDLDAPNLADDDFQDMMDEDDVPVGPVHREKWRTTQEGSILQKGPNLSLKPYPEPTRPSKLTKVEPTPGVGIGFYAPSRTLYSAPSTGRPPWPQGSTIVTAAPLAPMAPAWVAPKYAAAPPPPPFPTPHHPPPPPTPPPRILQRQWHQHQQHRFVHPHLHQPRPYHPRHPPPYPGMILSMGR